MSTAPDARVASRIVRDCAFRLRIAYQLPRGIELSELDDMIDSALEVHAFSKRICGAKDLFKFRISNHSLAEGVVGGRELTVYYGKLGQARAPRDRARVERTLTAVYGPVT